MDNSSTIRILIVDDRHLIRAAIQTYLERESDLEIIGVAKNGAEALKQIEKLAPDVAILDLEMPDLDGLTTIQIIRDRFIKTKILVLSSHDDRDNINRAIEAGAKGYLTKQTPGLELANTVRAINQGYFQLGPGLMEKLIISLSNSAGNNSNLEKKLVAALKKFKQDTNKQLAELVKAEFEEVNRDFEHRLGIHLHAQNRKHKELYSYIRKVEFKFYLLLLFQTIALCSLIAYWVVTS